MRIENVGGRAVRVVKMKVSAAKTETKEMKISSDFIKLDSALKLSGIAMTGGHAKQLVQDGEIRVNGEVCLQRGKKLSVGDRMQHRRDIFKIVKGIE